MKTFVVKYFALLLLLQLAARSSAQEHRDFIVAKISDSTGQPIIGAPCYLVSRGPANIFQVATSDKNGTIMFSSRHFAADREIIILANTLGGKRYSIKLADTLQLAGQLQAAVSQDTTAFYGKPNVTYQVGNYVKFTTMEDVLREYIVPVGVKKKNGKPYPFVFDELRRRPFENDPLLLINGIPVFDVRHIMHLDPLKVVSISVVSSRYFIADQVFDGIISVVTRNYNIDDTNLPAGALLVKYETAY